ncbi:amino acid transporter AVT3C-like [Anneissia japonica]|uniref:amino acid transporter AVT3C-like n=1 Tax=Anneissia japonica TaxID=1529436 RepID=UPI001425B2DC|nr:amino acid transporter AVT3C-like [Anneissia japonica]
MHGSEGSDSSVKIFANIFITFVGAGVLGLPFAFKEAGILEGIVIMILISAVSIKAMLLLIDCKYRLNRRPEIRKIYKIVEVETEENHQGNTYEKLDLLESHTNESNGFRHDVQDVKELKSSQKELDYGDLGYYALGNTGRTVVDTVIVISQTGFCCAYLIFITENLGSYIVKFATFQWLLFLLPPLAFLAMLRHLNHLAIFSLFADFANVFAYCVVFWFDFEHIHVLKKLHPKEISLDGFPFFLGIAIYCFEGAGMVLSLEASVLPSVRSKFRKIFVLALVLVTTLYIVFGVCGYLSFGPETENIITLNLPPGLFPLLVKGCLCFSLFFTYPMMMFPVSRIIENITTDDPLRNLNRGNIIRCSMVLLTGLIVLAIPNFTTLMALVGASCCTLLAFILPAIFHMKLCHETLTMRQLVFDWILIILGVVGCLIGTHDALHRMFSPEIPVGNSATLIPRVVQSNLTGHKST